MDESKISSEFASRLERFAPGRKIRAIVLLDVETDTAGATRRLTSEERQAAMEAARIFAQSALPEIDELLVREDGKRLSEDVSALGSITVEATAQGIAALARLHSVKAILEDQPISPLKKPSLNPTA